MGNSHGLAQEHAAVHLGDGARGLLGRAVANEAEAARLAHRVLHSMTVYPVLALCLPCSYCSTFWSGNNTNGPVHTSRSQTQ